MSREPGKPTRSWAVRQLASLPLFQLSTAGMELFHTNMLYWLAAERPDESIAVWNSFGLSAARIDQRTPFIRREWQHTDLVVAPGEAHPALVLENKIGAIPNPGQLDGYSAKLRSIQLPFRLDLSAFVLLTLTSPSFAMPEPWRSVTYRQLVPAFQETARRLSETDAALVEAYAGLVTQLDEVAAAYDPAGDLDGPVALSPEERWQLTESRLLALVERVRTGRFAELATRELTTALGEVGQVGAGFSNGSGIYEWFIPGPAGRRFGWQIQGGAFRLAVIGGSRDPHVKAGLEALVSEQYESYFDFTAPDRLLHTLSRYRGKKQWLGYKPSFVYRYAELAPATTWRELLELVTWFARRALEFVPGR